MQCVPHGPSGQTVYMNKQQNSWVGINVALRPGKGWQLHLKKKLLCEFLKLTWPSCWCCEDTLLSPKNKLRGGKRPSEGFLRCYLATLSPRACVLSLALSPQDKIETQLLLDKTLSHPMSRVIKVLESHEASDLWNGPARLAAKHSQ